MNKSIKIKHISGRIIDAKIRRLTNRDLDKILLLQDFIYESMVDKSLFAKTEKEEFENMINNKGEVIGVVTEDDELIAFGAMIKPKFKKFNLGYDLNYDDKKLISIAHIESTVVHSDYRGNRLQRTLVEELEKVAKDKGCCIFCATVAPQNEFSLNTFIKLGYKIAIEKEKYGGLKRYIVIKE